MKAEELIAKARGAIGLPTFYWLGQGGKSPQAPRPGSSYSVQQMFDDLKKNRLGPHAAGRTAEFETVALEVGYPRSRWREPVEACDCSGFTAWLVGVHRGSGTLPWIYTDSMYEYSNHRVAAAFHPPTTVAQLGSLVVYPSGRLGEGWGHVGLISRMAGAKVEAVVHCSSTNFRYAPPFDAIAETSAEVFERHGPLLYLRPRLLED